MLKKGIDYDYDCYGFDLLPYCCLCNHDTTVYSGYHKRCHHQKGKQTMQRLALHYRGDLRFCHRCLCCYYTACDSFVIIIHRVHDSIRIIRPPGEHNRLVVFLFCLRSASICLRSASICFNAHYYPAKQKYVQSFSIMYMLICTSRSRYRPPIGTVNPSPSRCGCSRTPVFTQLVTNFFGSFRYLFKKECVNHKNNIA